jgi:hypothetical protein
MRRCTTLTLILCLLTISTWAQNSILEQRGQYVLSQSDIDPALELLEFLVQSPLTPQERATITTEARAEFRETPAELLTSLQELSQIIRNIEATEDLELLGEFRQKAIAAFYKSAQDPNLASSYLDILLRKAPVVAYDPQTDVALTQQDLAASLAYYRQLNSYQGNQLSEQQMALLKQEVINGFPQIDVDTQRMLASGTILLSVFQANYQNMNSTQQESVKSHYRTTTGGPPSRTRGGESEQSESLQALTQNGLRQNDLMLNSLESAGGSRNYWSVVKNR